MCLGNEMLGKVRELALGHAKGRWRGSAVAVTLVHTQLPRPHSAGACCKYHRKGTEEEKTIKYEMLIEKGY